MRKLLLLFVILSLVLPSQAAFWNKKDKALEAEMEDKGYAGTLPDVDKMFQKSEKKIGTPIYEAQPGFDDPAELKPAPTSDPSFINIIQKKDKTSQYVNDTREIISIMEKLLDCIEDNGSVQLFNTRANVLAMNLDYLIEKYNGQPESYYESFRKLTEVNRYVKTIAQLRREAVTYQRYLAYQSSGSIYNPDNISQQLEYLKEELNTAIIMLKEEH